MNNKCELVCTQLYKICVHIQLYMSISACIYVLQHLLGSSYFQLPTFYLCKRVLVSCILSSYQLIIIILSFVIVIFYLVLLSVLSIRCSVDSKFYILHST